jgi:S-adenosylmethionine:tRNA ribosyltransferase-isomerase
MQIDLDDISAYDYELPEELIAQSPLAERSSSRLLVIDKQQQKWEHRQFQHITDYLHAGDCLVLNNSRVVPAKLKGFRAHTGGKWEGLYLKSLPDQHWEIIGQTKGRLLPGEKLCITSGPQGGFSPLYLELIEKTERAHWVVKPVSELDTPTLLNQYGEMPLPPYIERLKPQAEDIQRYQTVFAQHPGSVAAPTAGLHMTDEILTALKDKGVAIANVTLHVGLGTFRPVSAARLDEHHMHYEWCEVSVETCTIINHTKAHGGKVTALGTTAVRTLETAALSGTLQPYQGESNLFIRPPFQFRVIDQLITNFHLPKSTLLVLVSTFAGYELMQAVYQAAIQERYRFFSYGDAMLIK